MESPQFIRKVAHYYAAQLQLCYPKNLASLSLAKAIHCHMLTSGFHPRGHILNRLIDVYCKSSRIVYARKLFDQIPEPDIVPRTSLVSVYYLLGDIKTTCKMFEETLLRLYSEKFVVAFALMRLPRGATVKSRSSRTFGFVEPWIRF